MREMGLWGWWGWICGSDEGDGVGFAVVMREMGFHGRETFLGRLRCVCAEREKNCRLKSSEASFWLGLLST